MTETNQGRTTSSNGHIEVERLPRVPEDGSSYWLNSTTGRVDFTHQIFRFPARIHAPVIRWALGKYGRRGSMVLDPFGGSGSVQVECSARGISSIGIDIDPLACLLSRVKSNPLPSRSLKRAAEKVQSLLSRHCTKHRDREVRGGSDISRARFERESRGLNIPSIPNLEHWFRRYVAIDLAHIFGAVEAASLTKKESDFFRVCAAATIRRVCNADPMPVSGLEVTHVQAEINETRKIRVFDDFSRRVDRAISGMDQLYDEWNSIQPHAKAKVVCADVLSRRSGLVGVRKKYGQFPLAITSPPYCNAVEYSRRHKLEMFWLGLVDTSEDHLELSHSYIGRQRVRVADWENGKPFQNRPLETLIRRIERENHLRARAIRHYFASMSTFLEGMANVIRPRGTFICIIGDSVCAGIRVPTAKHVTNLASPYFDLNGSFSYAIRNFYMQYGLRNGQGIKREHVLVFKKRANGS